MLWNRSFPSKHLHTCLSPTSIWTSTSCVIFFAHFQLRYGSSNIIQYHPIDHQLQIQIGHPTPSNHPKTTKIHIDKYYIYIIYYIYTYYDIYCIIDMSTIQRQSTSHSILLADKRCPRLARATVSCASSSLVKGLRDAVAPENLVVETRNQTWKKQLDDIIYIWYWNILDIWWYMNPEMICEWWKTLQPLWLFRDGYKKWLKSTMESTEAVVTSLVTGPQFRTSIKQKTLLVWKRKQTYSCVKNRYTVFFLLIPK